MTTGLRILNYHNIACAPEGAALIKLYVTPEDFARQMACLRRVGIRGVSLSEGLWHLERNRAHRVVALTFDDGYADNLTNAAPTLRELGFSATCFIVTHCIGTHNEWDAGLLRVQKPLMNVAQLREWQAEGLELGSHTRTHPHLETLGIEAARAEIEGSRADLERITGGRIEHFCYPYGELNVRVAGQVKAAGYRSAVTTQRAWARADDDPFQLPRVSIDGRRGILRFALKAVTPYGAWRRPEVAA